MSDDIPFIFFSTTEADLFIASIAGGAITTTRNRAKAMVGTGWNEITSIYKELALLPNSEAMNWTITTQEGYEL